MISSISKKKKNKEKEEKKTAYFHIKQLKELTPVRKGFYSFLFSSVKYHKSAIFHDM